MNFIKSSGSMLMNVDPHNRRCGLTGIHQKSELFDRYHFTVTSTLPKSRSHNSERIFVYIV